MVKTAYISSSRHFTQSRAGIIFKWLNVLDYRGAAAIFPDVPFEQIHRSRSRFQDFLNTRIQGGTAKTDFHKHSQRNTKLLAQSLIRAYESDFLCFQQTLIVGNLVPVTPKIRPLFIAPIKTQVALIKAFFYDPEPALDTTYRFLIIVSAIQFWLGFLKAFVKTTAASVLLPPLSSIKYLANRGPFKTIRGSILWFGHPWSNSANFERLSETLFLSEIIAKLNSEPQLSGVRNIVMMNFQRDSLNTNIPHLFRATSLWSTPTPFSGFDYTHLLIRNCVAIWSFLLSQLRSPERFNDDLKANIAGYFLARISPHSGFLTNSNYQGDHIQDAMVSHGIPLKFIYYSVNNACPQTMPHIRPVETIAWKYNIANLHLTWDKQSKRWLEDQFIAADSRVVAAGPIMFAATNCKDLHRLNRPKNDPTKFYLGVYDVTPLSYEAGFKLGMGHGLYDIETCKSFLEDVIITANRVFGNDVRFIFKLKRQPLKDFHDNEYLVFQNQLIDKLGNRAILFEPDWNPWLTLDTCNAVIAIPYTSLVDAAHMTGLPAAYYSPFKTKIRCDYKSPITLHDIPSLEIWLNLRKNEPPQKLNWDVLRSTIKNISDAFQ